MSNLAAGAIGSLIAITVAFFVRLTAVPREIRSHDRQTRERDEDLAQWIADRTISLRRELHEARARLAADGILHSSEYYFRLGTLKEKALHEWRDQERHARRGVDGLYDGEGWLHTVWRRATGKHRPGLETPTQAKPVLDVWRTPPSLHQESEPAHPIDDPTERTLERAIQDASAKLRDYE